MNLPSKSEKEPSLLSPGNVKMALAISLGIGGLAVYANEISEVGKRDQNFAPKHALFGQPIAINPNKQLTVREWHEDTEDKGQIIGRFTLPSGDVATCFMPDIAQITDPNPGDKINLSHTLPAPECFEPGPPRVD